jgi:hypothetical protein
VPFLFQAGSSEGMRRPTKDDDQTVFKGATDLDHEKTLQGILSEISSETLTNLISLPIDTARAVYLLDSVRVKSEEEFNETITSFYVHLIRHTRKVCEPVDLEAAAAEALELLGETFLKRGGYRAALTEARSCLQGGLRFVFDMMTEQHKRKEHEKHINRVFKTALEPLEAKDKVGLMGALMKRLELHLGLEIKSQPPEWFAFHYELIIKAYIQSMERMNSVFRSL